MTLATFTRCSIHGRTTDFSHPDRVMVSGVTLAAPGIRDMFNQMLQGAAERALDEHGMGAFGAPKIAAAAHEAGHAVVGATLGYAITNVNLIEMRPGADIWGGITDHIGEPAPGTPMVGRVVVLRQARMLFAGLAAESRLRDFRHASSLDELVMSQMLAATIAEPSESPEALWRECVERDVDRRIASNYATLQVAARALYDKGRLRGSRLRKILAAIAVDGDRV